MQRITDLKEKLIFTAGYLLVIGLMWLLDMPCIFMHFLNIPCPGCGMTRAMLSVLRFDIVGAFRYHPMFWSIPIAYLYFLFDGKVFKNKIIDMSILIGIAAGFVIEWIVKICIHLA